MTHVTRTIDIPWTVILVDYDWILDISHSNIREANIPDEALAWPSPCFDPQPILSGSEAAVHYCHILDSFFFKIFG